MEERTRLISEIGKHLINSHHFWIFCHENPDGDALGCSLAAYGVLKDMGKEATVFTPQPLARMYRRLPHSDKVIATSDLPGEVPEVVLVSDNGAFTRMGRRYATQLTQKGIGPLAESKNAGCTLINIDHHLGNDYYGDINLVDISAACSGEILYHAFRQLKLPLDREAAINLYTSILTDTGRFSYGNTSRETFRIASELINLGADPFDVADRVYNTRTINQIKLLSSILNTIIAVNELGYTYCYVTQDMLRANGSVLSDTEGAVDLIKTISGFDACFLLKEEEDGRTKVSARSSSGFDVHAFARRFGGGGHPAASGFPLNFSIYEAPKRIAEEMRRFRIEDGSDGGGERPQEPS